MRIGDVILIRMENIDDLFYAKLVKLMNEYGYQMQDSTNKKVSLSFPGLEIIPERHQVFQNGKEIVLTGKEFQILMLLAENKGRVFSKEQIYDFVWNGGVYL